MRKTKEAKQQSTTKKEMKDCAQTPLWFAEVLQQRFFTFDLDVCCLPHTAKCTNFYSLEIGKNGLELPWGKHNFCNPPFSDPIPWIKRADYFAREFGSSTLIITPDCQETAYCRLLNEVASLVVHMPFRLQYKTVDGGGGGLEPVCKPPQSLALLIIRGQCTGLGRATSGRTSGSLVALNETTKGK